MEAHLVIMNLFFSLGRTGRYGIVSSSLPQFFFPALLCPIGFLPNVWNHPYKYELSHFYNVPGELTTIGEVE